MPQLFLPYEIIEEIFIYLPFEKVFELESNKRICKKIYEPKEHCWEKFEYKGNLSLLKWFTENNAKICTTQAMSVAAHYGYFEIIKWLHENRLNGCIDYSQDYFPPTAGYLKSADWIHVNCSERCKTNAMDFAASDGRLDIVKYLHENGYDCTKYAMASAASNGHFDVVKWLHENRKGYREAIYFATKYGHLDIATFLEEKYPVAKPSVFKKIIKRFRSFICDI